MIAVINSQCFYGNHWLVKKFECVDLRFLTLFIPMYESGGASFILSIRIKLFGQVSIRIKQQNYLGGGKIILLNLLWKCLRTSYICTHLWFCTALTNSNPRREICVTLTYVCIVLQGWLVNYNPTPSPLKFCLVLATASVLLTLNCCVSCNAVLVDSTLSLRLVQYRCSWCILYYLGLFNCWTISEKSVSHFIKVVPWRHEENFQPLGLNWFFWQFPISPSCCCHRLKQSPPFLERLKQESLRSSKCPKSTFD